MKAYLANGLFSLGDRLLNEIVADELRKAFPDLDLYVPQENVALNDKRAYASSKQISKGDDTYLLEADFLVAVIDGSEIDSGVACEIGKFSMLKSKHGEYPRPVFALYTDVRQQGRDNFNKIDALIEDGTENQFMYKNLYVIGTIKEFGYIEDSVPSLIESIQAHVVNLGL